MNRRLLPLTLSPTSSPTSSSTSSPAGAIPTAKDVARDAAQEEGSALVWVVLCLPMLFALLGLIFDGGAAIAGSQQADNVADQAARAGADQLNVSAARSQQSLFGSADTARASQAACDYVSVALPGANCMVTVNTDTVTVAVTSTVPTQFFGVIGIHTMNTNGSGSADSHTGIDEEVQ